MSFDRRESPDHEAPTAAVVTQGLTSGALDQLAACGAMTPEAIAMRIFEQPHQRDAIFSMLQQTRGNSFVQAVVAAGHTARPPHVAQSPGPMTGPHEASNQATYVALRTLLKAFAAELRQAAIQAQQAPDQPHTTGAGNEAVLVAMEDRCATLNGRATEILTLAKDVTLDTGSTDQMPTDLKLVNRAFHNYASSLEKAKGMSTPQRRFDPDTVTINKQIKKLHEIWGLNPAELVDGDLRTVGDATALEASVVDTQIAAAKAAMISVHGGNADTSRVTAHLVTLHEEVLRADPVTRSKLRKRIRPLLEEARTLNVSTPKLEDAIAALEKALP